MVTCMLFMKKCSLWSSCIEYKLKKRSVKNNKMKRLGNMNFFAWSKLIILKYKIIILNHRHEQRQDFNVYIKQYNTETGYVRLTLDSTRRESERKAIKFFSQEPKKKLRAMSRKHGSETQCHFSTLTCNNSLTLPAVLLWPTRRHSNKTHTSHSFKYFHESEPQEPKWLLSTLEVHKKLVSRLSMFSTKSLHLSEWHICIFCPLTNSCFYGLHIHD